MTTDNNEGSWGTDSSSGFLRHFTGTVKEPFFGTNPKIGEGRTLLLHWPVLIEEVHQDGFEEQVGEEETILFSCGKDWETPDGGETAVHGSGNATKQFHSSSAMGMLIDGITGKVKDYGDNASRADGDELSTDLTDAFEILRQRGDATAAATWDGLRWEFAEVVVDYGKDKEGNPIESKRALPVQFLGVAGEDKAAEKGKAKKEPGAKAETAAQKKAREAREAKAAAAEAEEQVSANGSTDPFEGIDIDDDLRNRLVEIAAEADDPEAFQAAAYEVDDLLENDEALAVVADDELVGAAYESLRA
jgi:hypothetical protein